MPERAGSGTEAAAAPRPWRTAPRRRERRPPPGTAPPPSPPQRRSGRRGAARSGRRTARKRSRGRAAPTAASRSEGKAVREPRAPRKGTRAGMGRAGARRKREGSRGTARPWVEVSAATSREPRGPNQMPEWCLSGRIRPIGAHRAVLRREAMGWGPRSSQCPGGGVTAALTPRRTGSPTPHSQRSGFTVPSLAVRRRSCSVLHLQP